MKKLKVGETDVDITYEQAIVLHNASGINCERTYIVPYPLGIIEQTGFFSRKFYNQKSWCCLACKWKSEIMTTRFI